MGDFVCLHSAPVDLSSDDGHRFVVDCTRAAEGLITDQELAEKYELSPADWSTITKDAALGKLIRAERDRRVLNGTAVRESSAKHLIKGPTILAEIMTGETTPRHKIDAFQALRQTAIAGDDPKGLPESERFIIRIDLTAGGGDVLIYDKPLKPMTPIDVSEGARSSNPSLLEGKPDVDE